MKIDSGLIRQEAMTGHASVSWKQTSARFHRGSAEEDSSEEYSRFSELLNGQDSLKETLERHNQEVTSNAAKRTSGISEKRDVETSLSKIRQSCIDYLFYLLFSRVTKKNESPCDYYSYGNSDGDTLSLSSLDANSFATPQEFTLSYSTETFHGEYEYAGYSVDGTVRTADGRELSFGLSFEMSSSFEEYYSERYDIQSIPAMINLCDPLVINLDTEIADLSDQKFTFDLDADGETEQISLLGRGSAFLALDLNGNGLIDDGSELFGAKTGNGFGELAAYDKDGNGWIDENDEIFEKLKIWVKNEDGEDELFSLKDKNVGAINLGALATQMSRRGPAGGFNGVLRQTGFFLYEDGTAGTVQHLDIAS